jgi:hypothetical protein
MSYNIKFYNPTPWSRTEYVTYGTPHQTDDSFWDAGLGFINVREVTVPANFDGEIELTSLGNSGLTQFTFHDNILDVFAAGFYPYIEYRDKGNVRRKAYFELADEDNVSGGLVNEGEIASNGRIKVLRWASRCHNLIGELTWTFFSESRKTKIALRIISESLDNYTDYVTDVTFGFDGPLKYVVDSWFWFRKEDNLIPGKYICDSQGVKVFGECWFLGGNVSAGTTPTPTELQSYAAAKSYPLYGLYDWSTTGWGLFNTSVSGLSSTLSSSLWQDRLSKNWFDPYEHKGRILGYRPAQTGDQDEFGAWTHLETVATYNVKNALFDQLTVAQETLRDGNYFEPGTFKFVNAEARTGYIIWDGKVRVYENTRGSNYDVLNRKYTSNGGTVVLPDTNASIDRSKTNIKEVATSNLKWQAHDAGHFGGIKSLAHDFLLYGDFSSYLQLKQKTQAQVKAYLPTLDAIDYHRFCYMPGGFGEHSNDPREFGRPLLEAVYAYKVLQDEEVLERCARKVTEELYWKWTGRFNEYWKGFGYYVESGNYLFGRDKESRDTWPPFFWVWQDALLMDGLYALYEVLLVHPNLATNSYYSTAKTYIEELMEGIGEFFVTYGCRPSNRTNPNQVATAICNEDLWKREYQYGIDTAYLSSDLSAAYAILSEPRKANQNAVYPASGTTVEIAPFGPSGTPEYLTDDLDDASVFVWAYGTDFNAWSLGLFSMVGKYHSNETIKARAQELYTYWVTQQGINSGEISNFKYMNLLGYPDPSA